MDEKPNGGRVVYSRPEGEGGGGEARPVAAARPSGGGAYGAPWQTLVPLSVGFALLVGLVIGLGYKSAGKVSEVNYGTKNDYLRLSTMSDALLNLRLALSRLDTEARMRDRQESGAGKVMLPPSDLRLRNERGEFEKLLAEFDKLSIPNPAKKQEVHDLAAAYVAATRDPKTYSLEGFGKNRDLDLKLRSLMSDLSEERTRLEEERSRTLKAAQDGIMNLM